MNKNKTFSDLIDSTIKLEADSTVIVPSDSTPEDILWQIALSSDSTASAKVQAVKELNSLRFNKAHTVKEPDNRTIQELIVDTRQHIKDAQQQLAVLEKEGLSDAD